MKKISKKMPKKILTKNIAKDIAEDIAKMAEEGKDISEFFSNSGVMKNVVKRVNVDFNKDMLQELDIIAGELNVSRQAVIKTYLRQALNQHYIAKSKAS